MTKPVDRVIANYLHEVAENYEHVPAVLMRNMLCAIAHNAPFAAVLAALAAAGGPATTEEAAQRLAAVREARRSSAERTEATEA